MDANSSESNINYHTDEQQTVGDHQQQATGDHQQQAAGDNQQQAAGDHQQQAAGDRQQQAAGDHQQQAAGDHQKQAAGDHQQQAAGDHQQQAAGDHQQRAAGDHQQRAAGNHQLKDGSSKAPYEINIFLQPSELGDETAETNETKVIEIFHQLDSSSATIITPTVLGSHDVKDTESSDSKNATALKITVTDEKHEQQHDIHFSENAANDRVDPINVDLVTTEVFLRSDKKDVEIATFTVASTLQNLTSIPEETASTTAIEETAKDANVIVYAKQSQSSDSEFVESMYTSTEGKESLIAQQGSYSSDNDVEEPVDILENLSSAEHESGNSEQLISKHTAALIDIPHSALNEKILKNKSSKMSDNKKYQKARIELSLDIEVGSDLPIIVVSSCDSRITTTPTVSDFQDAPENRANVFVKDRSSDSEGSTSTPTPDEPNSSQFLETESSSKGYEADASGTQDTISTPNLKRNIGQQISLDDVHHPRLSNRSSGSCVSTISSDKSKSSKVSARDADIETSEQTDAKPCCSYIASASGGDELPSTSGVLTMAKKKRKLSSGASSNIRESRRKRVSGPAVNKLKFLSSPTSTEDSLPRYNMYARSASDESSRYSFLSCFYKKSLTCCLIFTILCLISGAAFLILGNKVKTVELKTLFNTAGGCSLLLGMVVVACCTIRYVDTIRYVVNVLARELC